MELVDIDRGSRWIQSGWIQSRWIPVKPGSVAGLSECHYIYYILQTQRAYLASSVRVCAEAQLEKCSRNPTSPNPRCERRENAAMREELHGRRAP